MTKKIPFFRRLRLPQAELEAYYRTQRAEAYKLELPVRGLAWRRSVHGFVMAVVKLNSLFIGHRITLLGERSPRALRPTIYACAHVGRYDVETALQLIPGQSWLFMGDPGEVYKDIDGLLLWLNGTLFADTAYKEDRHIGKETCVKLLQQGGNLIIYPEGAWNITENLPSYMRPVEYRYLDHLPHTPNGKADFRALEEMAKET